MDSTQLQMPSGDVKVNAEELKRYIMMKQGILPFDSAYDNYFIKKYLELPSVRLKEHESYENLKRVQKLVKTATDMQFLKSIEVEYLQFRNRRIKLIQEIKEEMNHYGIERILVSSTINKHQADQ